MGLIRLSSDPRARNNWIVRNDPIKRIPLAIGIISIAIAALIGWGVIAIKTAWITKTCIIVASVVGAIAIIKSVFSFNISLPQRTPQVRLDYLGRPMTSSAVSSSRPSVRKRISDKGRRFLEAIKKRFPSKKTQADPKNIVAFYTQPDTKAKTGLSADLPGSTFTLDQVLAWDDEDLDIDGTYFEWLFPLGPDDKVGPYSPSVDKAMATQCDGFFKQNLLKAFKRLLAFYGLEITHEPSILEPLQKVVIQRSTNFEKRSKAWITTSNHNYHRITRILKCLKLFGLSSYGKEFYTILCDIFKNEGYDIISSAFTHPILGTWTKAKNG